MNDINDKSYVFQEEHNIPIILSAKRLEYALCAYHKALKEYKKTPWISRTKAEKWDEASVI